MARKTTGSTTLRKRKGVSPTESIPVQAETAQVAPTNTLNTAVTGFADSGNLDEEIRRRAYELYLQRNGEAGDANGDWFVAECEVRARHAAAGR